MEENVIAAKVLVICFMLHRMYGPGLYERVYEELFCHEWDKTGIPYGRQSPVKLIHDGKEFKSLAFRADIIINDLVLLEIKSVDRLADVHFKQTLTYLKLTGLKLGLLVNFNESLLKNGVRRVANNL